MFHVCRNLSFPDQSHVPSKFAEQVGLESDTIYAWLQFSYRTAEAPTIPQYHHELVKLTSLQEFSKWTIEEKKKAYRQAREKKEQELLNSSNEID